MRICIFGAGAIGGFVAVRLAQVPGVEVSVVARDGHLLRFPIGEPDGSESARIRHLSKAMNAAGLNAPVVPDIRAWIWAKMISSLSWNPLAVLTGSTLDHLARQPDIERLVRRMMREAEQLAEALGVQRWPLDIDGRIAAARNSGAHRMSMLQDWDRGRPLEIDVLTDSIAAMRELAGLETPTIDEVYALLRLKVAARLHP